MEFPFFVQVEIDISPTFSEPNILVVGTEKFIPNI